MSTFLRVSQVISAILLIITILLQHRGTGLGGAFGGQDLSYRSRRGIEKLLLRATIILAVILILSLIAQLVLPS